MYTVIRSATFKISIYLLITEAEQACLSLALLETRKAGFLA